ncbi:MAG: sterol desaturase family protein [Pseudomonadales bacterium]
MADQTSKELSGPFTELSNELFDVLANNLPSDLHWKTLLLTAVIALFIWWKRGGRGSKGADGHERAAGILEFLLPRAIYSHVSARVDIGLWVIERLLRPIWFVALLAAIAPTTEQHVIKVLEWTIGSSPGLHSNYAWMLLYSLLGLLVYDAVFFITHYTMHKVPALWAIHKVHHSAEVLTPLTRYREHFLAGPIWAAGYAFSLALVSGLFAWLFSGGITAATLFNVGFFALLFGFNGSFRHYHVQFHYPRWLSRWLHSPAMHHIHHSYLPQHWDKNFAAVTSIYDRLFGTLYIPEKDEFTPWGIGPESQEQNRSLWHNTIGPFRDWYQMLRGKTSNSAETLQKE